MTPSYVRATVAALSLFAAGVAVAGCANPEDVTDATQESAATALTYKEARGEPYFRETLTSLRPTYVTLNGFLRATYYLAKPLASEKDGWFYALYTKAEGLGTPENEASVRYWYGRSPERIAILEATYRRVRVLRDPLLGKASFENATEWLTAWKAECAASSVETCVDAARVLWAVAVNEPARLSPEALLLLTKELGPYPSYERARDEALVDGVVSDEEAAAIIAAERRHRAYGFSESFYLANRALLSPEATQRFQVYLGISATSIKHSFLDRYLAAYAASTKFAERNVVLHSDIDRIFALARTGGTAAAPRITSDVRADLVKFRNRYDDRFEPGALKRLDDFLGSTPVSGSARFPWAQGSTDTLRTTSTGATVKISIAAGDPAVAQELFYLNQVQYGPASALGAANGPYGELINGRPIGRWELQLGFANGMYQLRALAFASQGPSSGTGGSRLFVSAPMTAETVARGGSFDATSNVPLETRR